jgi:hypothetical protein
MVGFLLWALTSCYHQANQNGRELSSQKLALEFVLHIPVRCLTICIAVTDLVTAFAYKSWSGLSALSALLFGQELGQAIADNFVACFPRHCLTFLVTIQGTMTLGTPHLWFRLVTVMTLRMGERLKLCEEGLSFLAPTALRAQNNTNG